MKVMIIIKTKGFKYQGEILDENESTLIIDDIKLGRLEIAKDEIAIRGVLND